MEDKEAITQIQQEEQTEINSMLDEEQSMAETGEKKHENIEAKIVADKKELVSQKTESKSNASKKPKQSAQQTHKGKTTVPQPFSLATEKRMSRQRHGSMDLSSASEEITADEHSKLSKSASFSHKAQPSQVAREASNLRRTATATTSSRSKAACKEQMNKKTTNAMKTKDKTVVERQNLPSNSKKQQAKELEMKKLDKSFTFKASPLPSFYHRKDPPSKPEIKKIRATRAKSPVLGRHRNNSSTNTENSKTENKGKNSSSTGISDGAKETSANAENTRTEKKSKSNGSTGISTTAKETLNRIIKGTKKALNTSKETMKLVVSKA